MGNKALPFGKHNIFQSFLTVHHYAMTVTPLPILVLVLAAQKFAHSSQCEVLNVDLGRSLMQKDEFIDLVAYIGRAPIRY